MSRPETSGPPELYYNETEAKKYAKNSRIMDIQAEMSERAIQLLELKDPETSFVLDIGCGSGISGSVLTEEGIPWMGVDISAPMLEQAKNFMEVEGDLVLADMGAGLPFTAGAFDGAISISAIQWLCHANRANENPERRLLEFFQSLFACLTRGARAVFQFYPDSPAQAELICNQSRKAGFNGGLVIDYPESQKNKKVYLVVMTSGIEFLPKGITDEEDVQQKDRVDNACRQAFSSGKRHNNKKKIPGTKEWIELKKERQRNRGKIHQKLKMTVSADKTVVFTFGEQKVEAHPRLNQISGMLKDLLAVTSSEGDKVEVPIKHEVEKEDLELLNKFVEVCQEKFGDDLVSYAEDLSHWMSNIPQKKDDMLPIASDTDKETLIRSANLGDYLMVYPFLAFCTFVLSERCQDLDLAKMRDYLNEEDDFDPEQREIIESCPEFKNL
ncbi:hypothetical protein M3Y97_00633700 [Aphelenchoides bicaudatus]|nr:hypothetical protein M3Y97_00633700 [Aphelenchoides bicaudatus]